MLRPLAPSELPPPYRRRKSGTVDLEWYPGTYELRLIGVWYQRRYRFFTTVSDFFAWFLSAENAGIELYAHNGGRSDFAFFIPELVARGIPTSGLVNGSSVFALDITVGKRKFKLRDSLWLLMSTLEEAGRGFVGRGKADLSGFDAPLNVLRDYNEADCVLLDDVLESLDETWGELGTRIGLTNASTAFSLFRSKYLKTPIKTHASVNDTFRKRAFFASRVEVFARSVRRALDASGAPYAVGFDQRSAHPRSYSEPMPGELLDITSRPLPGSVWFVDCQVHVPADINIAPLPYRAEKGGRVCHPTGTWPALISQCEAELLEDCGGHYEPHQYYCFRPHTDLAGFASAMFEVKEKGYDASGEPNARGRVAKYALNGGGYGKMGEKPDRLQLLIGPIPDKFLYMPNGDISSDSERIRIIAPNIALAPQYRPAPHEHMPMPSAVGAHTRVRITRDMQRYESEGSIVLYIDTDGFKGTLAKTDWTPKLGKGMGEYKLEYARIVDGYFAGPKLYCVKDAAAEQIVIRAKGFPTALYGEVSDKGAARKGYAIASDEKRDMGALMTWERIYAAAGMSPLEDADKGGRISYNRMQRIPEALRDLAVHGNELKPRDVLVTKMPRAPTPSRTFDSDGFSEPLHVSIGADS